MSNNKTNISTNKLPLGQYVRLINRVNRAWKVTQKKWPDSIIARKFRDLKPVLQVELLSNYRNTTYLAYDKFNSEKPQNMVLKNGVLQPKDPLLGIKIREEKINMSDEDLATAIREYREGSKDDADHLPWRRVKRFLTPSQFLEFYDGEIQEFMKHDNYMKGYFNDVK
jgi:hypothetical protein